MVQNVVGNEKAFIILNKENEYIYLIMDLSLKTKICGLFPQP